MKELETELWEQFISLEEYDSEIDFYDIVRKLSSEMLDEMNADDMILGLAKLDENAIERVEKRKLLLEYLENKKNDKKPLDNFVKGKVCRRKQ